LSASWWPAKDILLGCRQIWRHTAEMFALKLFYLRKFRANLHSELTVLFTEPFWQLNEADVKEMGFPQETSYSYQQIRRVCQENVSTVRMQTWATQSKRVHETGVNRCYQLQRGGTWHLCS